MKRLIKLNNTYYHLTNNDNFNIQDNFNNKQQEMGQGLYVTNLEDLKKWDQLLQSREFVVEIEANLNIIKEEDFPSQSKMVKDLMDVGYTADNIHDYFPTGETFNRSPLNIAVKREWAKLNNYDAIETFYDEGYQLVILNTDKCSIKSIKSIYDFI